ncbi:MAG TPA: nucleoside-diphosphate kinase [Candidatus Glassbacteria bacterium]|nr:nucleoside-diphosphate kinase [Candidatus Glassbacteria bacterium]
MTELTLAMIKPDAMAAGYAGKIIAHLEDEGFRIVALKKIRVSRTMAEEFYGEHLGKPFFKDLVEFVTSAPVIALALEADNAVARLRQVIGATDPAEAEEGTVRALYAESKQRNAIHASDSPASAGRELNFFFSRSDLIV